MHLTLLEKFILKIRTLKKLIYYYKKLKPELDLKAFKHEAPFKYSHPPKLVKFILEGIQLQYWKNSGLYG